MLEALAQGSAALLWMLATSAARSFVLAAVAAAGLAAFRSRTTSVRLFTWTCVLYASLVLPLLAGLLPAVEVGAPDFVQHQISSLQIGTAQKPQGVTGLAAHPAVRRELE